MRRGILLTVLIVAGLAAVSSACSVAGLAEPLQTGAAAPNFTLPSQENTPVSLVDYRGKWVVLYFYPKDMSSGCSLEAHNFERDLAKYGAANAVVLGVSLDSVKSHETFCTKDSLTFHLLADPDHKVVSAYGSLGGFAGITIANRNTFLIDPQGKIAQVWVKVNPNTSASDVLAALP